MIRFSEMEYRRPDMEALKALVEEATRKVKEAGSSEEVKEAYFTLQEKELDADTMFTLAHIRNTSPEQYRLCIFSGKRCTGKSPGSTQMVYESCGAGGYFRLCECRSCLSICHGRPGRSIQLVYESGGTGRQDWNEECCLVL